MSSEVHDAYTRVGDDDDLGRGFNLFRLFTLGPMFAPGAGDVERCSAAIALRGSSPARVGRAKLPA